MKKFSIFIVSLFFAINCYSQKVQKWGEMSNINNDVLEFFLGVSSNEQFSNSIIGEAENGNQVDYLFCKKNNELYNNDSIIYFASLFQTYLGINNLDYLEFTNPEFKYRAIPPLDAPGGGTFRDNENYFFVRFPYGEEIDYASNNRFILSGNWWSSGIQESSKRRDLWRDLFLSVILQSELLTDEMSGGSNETYKATQLKEFNEYQEILKTAGGHIKTIADILNDATAFHEVALKNDVSDYLTKMAEISKDVHRQKQLKKLSESLGYLEVGSEILSGTLKTLILKSLQSAEAERRLTIIEKWINSSSPGYNDSEIYNGFLDAREKYKLINEETYSAIGLATLENPNVWRSAFNIAIGPVTDLVKDALSEKFSLSVSTGVFFVTSQLIDLTVELNNKYDLLRLAAMAATLEEYLGSYLHNNLISIYNNEDEIIFKQTLLEVNFFLGYYYYKMIKQVYDNKWYSKTNLLIELAPYFESNGITDDQVIVYCNEGINRCVNYYNKYCQPFGLSKYDIVWFEALIKGFENQDIFYLSEGRVSSGEVMQNENVNFSIRYTNLLGNPPSNISVVIDGTDHPMTNESSNDNFLEGVSYNFNTSFSQVNSHSFYFEAHSEDGNSFTWPNDPLNLVIIENTEGHDLGLYRLDLEKDWLNIGENLNYTYVLNNLGEYSETNYSIKYELMNSDGSIVESAIDVGNFIDVGKKLTVTNETFSISDLPSGFYNFKVIVDLGTDYAKGNNYIEQTIFIGNSNPFQTYLMNDNDEIYILGNNYTLNGHSVSYSAHDGENARVTVDGVKRDISYNEFSFFDAYRLNLIYKGYFSSSEASFRYASPSSEVSFSPQKLVIEAGKTGTFNVISNEDDPTPNIDVTLEGGLDASIVQNWKTDAYTKGSPYTNVFFDVTVPSNAERRLYEFWVDMSANGSFFQKLNVEVIDPQPDFNYSLSKNSITIGPSMSEQLNLDLTALNGFNENIVLSFTGIPSGLSITPSENNFSLPQILQLNIDVDENFEAFDNYAVEMNMVSGSKSKNQNLYINVIDNSNNFLTITDVQYADKDSKTDSLVVYYDAQFEYANTSVTSNWQYQINGVDWIDIPASQILKNTAKTGGSDSIIWVIPSGTTIYSQEAKFRMKNKNGYDFLTNFESPNFNDFDPNPDFAGIYIENDILYVIDAKESPTRLRLFDLSNNYEYIRSYTLSEVPIDENLQMVKCNGYFYIINKYDSKAYMYTESLNFDRTVNINSEIDAVFSMDGSLYAYANESDNERIISLNTFVQDVSSVPSPYTGRAYYAFSTGNNIWIGDGDDIYRCSEDLQSYTLYNIGINVEAGACVHNDTLFLTADDANFYLLSLYNPYSFFSESNYFTINNTFKPVVESGISITTAEDTPILNAISLTEIISDLDTPFENLDLSLVDVNPNINVEFNSDNSSLNVYPSPDWFGSSLFIIRAKDNYNTTEEEATVLVEPINDEPKINNISWIEWEEDNNFSLLLDTIVFDVDDGFEELNIEADIVDNESIQVEYNFHDRRFLFSQEENYFTDSTLMIISVTDGSNLTTVDSVNIRIDAVNDAPSYFEKLSLSKAICNSEDSLYFNWSESFDIDDDKIEYLFSLNSEFIDTSLVLNDTSFYFSPDKFNSSDSIILFSWDVHAWDGAKFSSSGSQIFSSYFNQPIVNNIVKDICEGEGFLAGSDSFNETGTYQIQLTNYCGCDSLINLDLTVNPLPFVDLGPDLSISTSDNVNIDAGEGFVSYLWNTGEEDRILSLYGLDEGKYGYSVLVTDENNCSNSDDITVLVSVPTNLNNASENRNILVYPNPTTGDLRIKFDFISNSKTLIETIDSKGRVVNHHLLTNINPNEAFQLDLNDQPDGVYFIRIINNGYQRIIKIVKE